MRTVPSLSPATEALLAPARVVLPLAPSVEVRAIARAIAAVESPALAVPRVMGRPRWVFAAAAGAVIGVGAAAFAARTWQAAPTSLPDRMDEVARPAAVERLAGGRSAPLPENAGPENSSPPGQEPARHVAVKAPVTTVPPTNAELRLLRLARAQLVDGHFAAALAAIAEHGRRFPNGRLAEEREALRVKSLEGLGRFGEAQRAAVEFHARFPQSVFLSAFGRMTDPEQ